MYLLYHTFGGLSRGFLNFFSNSLKFDTEVLFPLCTSIIALLREVVKRFFEDF
nr:MAG TPA: hypothetical protein [Caudoviricetes sp.]